MIIWREKRVLLIVTGALLAANLLFFFTYRVQYQQRVDDMRGRLEQARSQLDAARQNRVELASQIEAHDRIVSTIEKVFAEWWSTPDERLTRVITEVQSLGRKCGLEPRSFNFTRNEASDRLGTMTMGISFNVEGTYAQARQLINLIELSDEFLIIDSVSLRNAADDRLALNLVLRTLFRGSGESSAAVAPVTGG
jgi:hypothetical protein